MNRPSDTIEHAPGRAPLPATSWTLLAEAVGEDGARARSELSQRYFRPVRAYLGAIVRDTERADELTQAFFERIMLSGRLIQTADRTKGSFRSLLKQALRNFVTDDGRRVQVSTRREVHPDDDERGWDAIGAAVNESAESQYHDAWVRALLEHALDTVRDECRARGQEEHFDLFAARYLHDGGAPPSWREIGHPRQLDEKAARNRTETVARRFRVVLRRMLIDEAGSTRAVDREVAELLERL